MSLSERVQEHAYERRWLILARPVLQPARDRARQLDPQRRDPDDRRASSTRRTASCSGWSTRTRSCSPGCCSPRAASATASAGGPRCRSASSIFGLGSLLSALASTSDQLIATRAFMGIGGAFIMPATLSIITNVFPANERGQGDRRLGRHRGYRRRARAAHRRVPARALLLGLGLPREPPDRRGRPPRRRVPHPDLEGPERAAARSGRRGALDRRALRVALRDHRGADQGWTDPTILALLRRWRSCSSRRSSCGRCASDHPMLDLRFFKNPRFSAASGASRDVLRDVRLDLPADAVPPVRARLLAARGRDPALPFALVDDGDRRRSAPVVERIGTKITVASGLTIVTVGPGADDSRSQTDSSLRRSRRGA